MGWSSYSTDDRAIRSVSMGYDKVTTDNMSTVFKQNVERKAHSEMLPSTMKGFREARDSDIHPLTVPTQLYLDVTGSMGGVPVHLIKEGLPHLISSAIQKGIPDIALMFGAIGDHECDNYPLQMAQFESGDAELDMWLERTYVEGGGGGNMGESYALAWFTAANFIQTDAWDKRQQKGFVFTIGDEPTLLNYPGSALKGIFGDNLPQAAGNYTAQELYDKCAEKNHTFHIHVNHTSNRTTNMHDIMGQNCITTSDYTQIPDIIVNTMLSHLDVSSGTLQQPKDSDDSEDETKITL